ncbi:MAG: sarcosine oxidase subunit gamma family protein [Casimicrobiaceae bacterium]
MADTLAARSPLGTPAHEAGRCHGNRETVHISEQPLASSMQLRFDESDASVIAAVATATGLHLAARGCAVRGQDNHALWLGPGDWLVTPALPSSVTNALVESVAPRLAVFETNDLWARLRLCGPCSSPVLASGCAVDLDPRWVVPGAVAATRLARISALIHYVDRLPVYDIYVERSYARYLWTWLVDAMVEFLQPKER